MFGTEFFGKIVGDNYKHALWLNAVSYLEYRGFRKIARSQQTDDMNLELLLHSMEEVRHAVFFKRKAIDLGGDEFQSYDVKRLLGGVAPKKYFFDLDADVFAMISRHDSVELHKAAYVLISYLIETRAMSVYENYNAVLKQTQAAFNLDAIIKEEESHLNDMIEASKSVLLKYDVTMQSLEVLESNAFSGFYKSCLEQLK